VTYSPEIADILPVTNAPSLHVKRISHKETWIPDRGVWNIVQYSFS